MKIKPPPGFMVPEGTKEGDYFKSLDEWQLCEDGKIELCEVDGNPLPDHKDEEKDTSTMSMGDRLDYGMDQMKKGY